MMSTVETSESDCDFKAGRDSFNFLNKFCKQTSSVASEKKDIFWPSSNIFTLVKFFIEDSAIFSVTIYLRTLPPLPSIPLRC